ncbi:MAG: glycosyltransferase family 39 protein [Magnetospirillum sp. WYHS-4]
MIAGLVVALELLACLGLGAALLRLSGVASALERDEWLGWAFALGLGSLGWLVFFLGAVGFFSPVPLALLLLAGTAGLWFLRDLPSVRSDPTAFGPWGWLLAAGLAVALGFDILEGLSPPADADTMAYHFDLPKRFLAAGRLFFVPRAMDGAIPMLVHMTYVPALGLGGEKALTLWTMASGWGASALLYAVARRWLDRRWSLAATLAFLTLPAVVYGAGTGQVEVRNALFVLVAALAVAEARATGDTRWAALAGIAVGFYMGSKLTGLQFGLACGLVILFQRHWLSHGIVFGLAALFAGGQWYGWNWWHSGDPLFPILYGLVDYRIPGSWDADHQAELWRFIREEERAVPNNLAWMLAYPFVATLAGKPVFESGRTGLGPLILMVLPFALAGLWRFRERLKGRRLSTVAAVTGLFYVVWFLVGSSQRIRHLIPVFPLLLLCVMVAAERWAGRRGLFRPLAAALTLALGLQLGGQGVFSLKFAIHVLRSEPRDTFLERNVIGYAGARWVNENLEPASRIFVYLRWLNYLIDVPVHYGHSTQAAQVDLRAEAADPIRFYHQLAAVGTTHLLVIDRDDRSPPRSLDLWRGLREKGCLAEKKVIAGTSFGSRTLGSEEDSRPIREIVFQLKGPECLR